MLTELLTSIILLAGGMISNLFAQQIPSVNFWTRMANDELAARITDEMTDSENIWASVKSDNYVNQDFPYEGNTYASITVRYMKKYGYDVSMKDITFVSVSGFCSSGSSAVIDLLKEIKGCYVPDAEIRFIKDPYGIVEMEDALVNHWEFINSSAAISDFLDICKK